MYNKLLNNDQYEENGQLTGSSPEPASAELAELNDKLRQENEALINNTDDIIWSVCRNFKLIAANKGFIQSIYNAVGITLRRGDYLLNPEIYPADFLTLWETFYKKALQGETFKEEIHIPAFNSGKEMWLEIGFNPIHTQNAVVGIACYSRNITERKLAEKLKREIEAKYQSFFETSMDGFLLADDTGNIFTANPAACAIFLMTEEEICKAGRAGVMDLTDQRSEFFLQQRKLTGRAKGELVLIRKDGTRFLSDVTSSVYTDIYGQKKTSIIIRDITERKKAEDKRKESELRYRSLIEQANDAICIADISMKVIDVNPSGCQLLGYSKEEFLLLSIIDIFLPEDLKANPLKIDELKAGKAISNERRFKRKDGTIVEVELNGKLLDDGRFILFGRDISERKQAERQIKESELRYRSFIEQATDAICIADASLRFIDINPYACEFLGYTKEEALQLFVPDILFPEDMAMNPINKFDTIKINEIVRNERRFKRKDGSSVIMEISTRLMEDGRFIMFGHDVSERKKAESELKENEGRLSVAAQIAKLGYWEYDVASNMFKFNDQFYSIFKTTAEKVGGYKMSSEQYADLFVHPDDISIVIKAASDAIKSPDPNYNHQIEHKIKYANGETGYMASRYFIAKNETGRTIKTFGAIQDITESKNREAKLLQSEASLDLMNKELELKNKELEHFAFVASHDLQEPLRTTSSFINLLQQQYKGKLDEKADKYLHYITDSTDRMKILITDLLDYSRIGNKKELQQVDCNAVLNELLQDLGTTLKETGAEINVEPLPVISGYQTEIKQLFQNLIVNAIKFRKKDTIPQISISAQKDKSNWTFAIRDNGIGMAEDHTERIFIIFQRLHTRTEYEGSGIGLAHCKKIVGLHGGDIWVKSKPNEGATFYFTIP